MRGRPRPIRCDNGPALTNQVFADWCKQHGIELRYKQPSTADQNVYIERCNRTYREEILSAYLFALLTEVRDITEELLDLCNEIQPHDALGNLPPGRYSELVLPTRNFS